MTNHTIGTRDEWLEERLKLLTAEKALTRQSDEVARMIRQLPWVRIDKEYQFETENGVVSLVELFQGRSQLLVYHMMFGPEYEVACPLCSAIADGFSGSVVHLAHHDVTLCAVSRAPFSKLETFKRRMGWTFPWASSFNSDFNFDFHVSHTDEEWQSGAVEYNFHRNDFRPQPGEEQPFNDHAARTGTTWDTYRREGPGMSSFALEDGIVYHTYSTYERGVDILWGAYQWLDRAPLGRNESEMWWRHHDAYDRE